MSEVNNPAESSDTTSSAQPQDAEFAEDGSSNDATEPSSNAPEHLAEEAATLDADAGAADEPLDDAAEPSSDDSESADDAQPKTSARPPDPRQLRIESLERTIAERDATLRDYIRAHKKAGADLEAFKQRLERDRELELEREKARLIETMFEVADNLERSVEASSAATTVDSLREGLELVHRLFQQKLTELGLEAYDPVGQDFDPASMEAVGLVPVSDKALDRKVVTTLKPGYRVGERELRPAIVQVGRFTG